MKSAKWLTELWLAVVALALAVPGARGDAPGIAPDGVQLWEGGPYWADRNIGAENPWDYGLYFWWGDTTGYRPTGTTFSFDFSWTNSAISTYGKSVATLRREGWVVLKDSDYVLLPVHDAAHIQWGGAWRMPTAQELRDLSNQCDWTWTMTNGVYGRLVRGRGDYSVNSIFLPSAGYCSGTSLYGTGFLSSYYSGGCYWSSVPNSDVDASSWTLGFGSGGCSMESLSCRYGGLSVRPVRGAASDTYTVSFDPNGGEGEMEPETIVANGTLVLPDCSFTHSVFSFEGWAKTRERAADRIVDYAVGHEMEVTRDTTLYAVWGGNYYKIRLHGNGVTTEEGEGWVDVIVPYEESRNLPSNPFTKNGIVPGDVSDKLRGWSLGTPEYDWRTSDNLLPKNWAASASEEYFPEWKQLGWANDIGWWNVLHLYAIWDNEVKVKIRREDGDDVVPESLKEHIKFLIEGDRRWNTEAESAMVPPGTHRLKIQVDSGYETYVPGLQVFLCTRQLFPVEAGVYEFEIDSVSGPQTIEFDIRLTGQAEAIPVYFHCTGKKTPEQQAEWPDFPEFDPEQVVLKVCAEAIQPLTLGAGDLVVSANDGIWLPAGTYWVKAEYKETQGSAIPYWGTAGEEYAKITVKAPSLDVDIDYYPFGRKSIHGFALLTFEGEEMDVSVDHVWFVGNRNGDGGSLSATEFPTAERQDGRVFSGWLSMDGQYKAESFHELRDLAWKQLHGWRLKPSKRRQAYRAVWKEASGNGTGGTETGGGVIEDVPLNASMSLSGETMGFPGTATVSTGGSASWFGQTSESHDGTGAARSGAIGNGQTSWMEMEATGPGTISFQWKISCEDSDIEDGEDHSGDSTGDDNRIRYWDYAEFSVNGTRMAVLAGVDDWTPASFDLPAGSHVLRWTYQKDESVSVGDDCAWVDEVTWTPTAVSQQVTFDAHGGSGVAETMDFAFGGQYDGLPTPKWSGHAFLGWFTAAQGGTEVTDGDWVTPAATRTLHAHWTDRQVTTFNGNGGSPKMQATTNTIYAKYGVFPEAKRSGNVLVGWFNAAEGGKQVYTNSTVTLAATRTLYAHWTDQQVTTFNANGGTPKTQATTNTIYAKYGVFPEVKRSGNAFLGWFNAAEGGKRVYTNSTVTLNASRTLYAHWTDQQVTTFKGNGGTPATQATTNTIYAKYGTLPEATWANHVFQGWFTAAEGGKRVYTNSTVTLNAARTLYAQWTDQQVTTFRKNDGTTTATVETNIMGTAYGPLPEPKWSGHVFLGWFTAAEGGIEVTAEDVVTPTTKRTLYGHWTDQQVTTFKGNGGSPATQTTTNTIYGKYGVFPEAKRSGHAFLGWFNAPEGGKQVYTNSTVTLSATRTLYAHWTDQQVTIFKGNGGTPATQATTNTIYAKYGTLPEATWAGHVFLGWFNAAEGGKRVYTNSTVTLAAKRTLYAHWRAEASGLSITGFSMAKPAGGATAKSGRAALGGVLSFEASASEVYELQWTPVLGSEWTTLHRWTAPADGPSTIEVPVTPGETTGFFRLAVPVP